MKRCSIIVIGLVLLMGLSSASFAFYPIPDDYTTVQMYQGWYDDALVWFFCTDTNDIAWAWNEEVTLATKLTSAIGAGAAAVYVVRNPAASQGSIFSTVPGLADYSGVWQVTYVDWQPGFVKDPITSVAEITTLVGTGAVTTTTTNVVVDCPILAVGPLGGPWYPAPAGTYRIPQARVMYNYTYTKQVDLPVYAVFCRNPITRRINTSYVTITDAETVATATLLNANYAPALTDVPYSDTMRFWVILSSPWLCQLPVIEACPTSFDWQNQNYDYSPIQRLTLLNRVTIPYWTVINNGNYINTLLTSGGLTVNSESERINTSMAAPL